MDEVRVVVAHQERATLRVGDVFLKIDADQANTDREVDAMALAPLPTPEVLWHNPPVIALAALPGVALGRLGERSAASREAWVATGAAVRVLHDAPLPPWAAKARDDYHRLDSECDWLLRNGVVPPAVVAYNRDNARTAFRHFTPVFAHGDLQVDHVFVDGDVVTGVIDWSEGDPGTPCSTWPRSTMGHPEHLDDVIAGYGAGTDRTVIGAWWSLRSLLKIRWLIEHGFDPSLPGCEIDVLTAQMTGRGITDSDAP